MMRLVSEGVIKRVMNPNVKKKKSLAQVLISVYRVDQENEKNI